MSKYSEILKEMGKSVVASDNYNNQVIVLEIDWSLVDNKQTIYRQSPRRYDTIIFIGTIKGELEINIDYVNYKVQENSILMIMPTHIIQIIAHSNDLHALALIITKPFGEKLAYSDSRTPSLISYFDLKKNPLNKFSKSEFQRITSGMDVIRQRIRKQGHMFYEESIKLTLQMFALDFGDIYLSKRNNVNKPLLSRHEEIFGDFQILLRNNCKKEHNVKFYSDKLCITTQYLSAILKEQSGKSAIQWIQEALMIEAKVLLKMPRISIQQVAYKLHFPDQSSFGKFFKKHEGISPKKFRKGE